MSDDLIPGGAVVIHRGREFTVGVDNGGHVYLPDLPDAWSIRNYDSRAGQWGGPPLYNRWVHKDQITVRTDDDRVC